MAFETINDIFKSNTIRYLIKVREMENYILVIELSNVPSYIYNNKDLYLDDNYIYFCVFSPEASFAFNLVTKIAKSNKVLWIFQEPELMQMWWIELTKEQLPEKGGLLIFVPLEISWNIYTWN